MNRELAIVGLLVCILNPKTNERPPLLATSPSSSYVLGGFTFFHFLLSPFHTNDHFFVFCPPPNFPVTYQSVSPPFSPI